MQRRLKKSAVPHIFNWSKQLTPAAENRRDRRKRKLLMEEEVQQKRLRMEEEEDRQRDLAMTEVGAQENVTSTDDLTGTSHRF